MHAVIKVRRLQMDLKSLVTICFVHRTGQRGPLVTIQTDSTGKNRVRIWIWHNDGPVLAHCLPLLSTNMIFAYPALKVNQQQDHVRKSVPSGRLDVPSCAVCLFIYISGMIKLAVKHLSGPCIIFQMKMFMLSWAPFQYVSHVISLELRLRQQDMTCGGQTHCTWLHPKPIPCVPWPSLETFVVVGMADVLRDKNLNLVEREFAAHRLKCINIVALKEKVGVNPRGT